MSFRPEICQFTVRLSGEAGFVVPNVSLLLILKYEIIRHVPENFIYI
jgi:hypothetical protein